MNFSLTDVFFATIVDRLYISRFSNNSNRDENEHQPDDESQISEEPCQLKTNTHLKNFLRTRFRLIF